MPDNNKQYYVFVPGEAQGRVVDSAAFEAGKDLLYKSFPDAQVSEISKYNPEDTDYRDNDQYQVLVPGMMSPTTIDSKTFNSKKDEFFKMYPDAEVSRVRDYSDDYWRPKLQEAQAALASFDDENGEFMTQYEDDRRNATSMQRGMGAASLTDAQKNLAENHEKYDNLSSQRNALGEAIYNNPIIARGRRQAYENAVSLRQQYLDLADKAESGDERRDYKRAAKLQGDAAELFSAPSQFGNSDKSGFAKYLDDYAKGAVNTFSDRDFWTRGLTQIGRDFDLHGIRKKVQEAEKNKGGALEPGDYDRILSAGEKAQLFAFYNLAYAQADEEIGRAKDLSSAYRAGQSAAESAGFMAEFALGTGLGNLAGKAILKGSTNAFARWMGEAMMSQKAQAAAVQSGLLPAIQRTGWQQVGRSAAQSLVNGAIRAGITQPLGTLSNIATKMNETNDDGELNSVGRGIWLGLSDAFIENWSESFGNTIDGVFGIAGEGISKLGKGYKIKTNFGQMARWAMNSPFTQTLKEAGFNGFIGEMMEEWAGNAVRLSTGLMDKDEFKQFASIQQQLEMAASFAPMSLIGLSGQVVGGVKHRQEYNRLAEEAKQILMKNGVSQPEIEGLFNTRWATSEDVAAKLAPYAQRVLNSGSESAKSDYGKILRLAEEAGATSFNDAMEEIKNEGRRNEIRDQISANTGKFWQDFNSPEAKDENGNPEVIQQVRVIEFSDGTRQYVISGASIDNGNRTYATITEDGKQGFISDREINDGLENGSIVSDNEMMLNDYLQSRVDASDKDAEAQRMNEEIRQKLLDVRQRIEQNPSFNVGTVESPLNATVIPESVNANGLTAIWSDSEGNEQVRGFTWKEVGDYLGMPISAKTDAELNEEAAEVSRQADARKEEYNEIPIGSQITVLIDTGGETPESQTYRFGKAVHNEDEDFVRIYVLDENGNAITDERGEELWFIEDMVSGLDSYSAPSSVASANEQSAASSPAAEPVNTPSVQSAQPAVEKYTDANGVVNRTAFQNTEPEEWAKWNDEQNGDGGIDTQQAVNAKIKKLNKEVNEVDKKLADEDNPDTRENLKSQKVELVNRLNTWQRVLDSYSAPSSVAPATEQATASPAAPVSEATSQDAEAPTSSAGGQNEQMTREEMESFLDNIDALIASASTDEERAILLENKRKILEDYYKEIGTEQPIVATRGDVLDKLAENGVSEENIKTVDSELKYSKKHNHLVRGFRVGGKIYVITDDIASARDARSTYIHERQHGISSRRKLGRAVADILKYNRDTLLDYIFKLSGADYSEYESTSALGDELVSMAMEVAYSSTPENLEANLRSLGIDNQEIINFVKSIDNEQRNDQSLSKARGDSLQRNNAQRGVGQDGRDSQTGPAGDLGQQGRGSFRSGIQGTGELQGEQGGREVGQSADTGEIQVGEQNDTATPQNTVILESEDNNSEESNTSSETIERLDSEGIAANGDEVRFSVRYVPTDDQQSQIVDDIVSSTGVSKEKAEQWLKSETSLAALILNGENEPYLNYTGDDRYKAIKQDSDYPQGTVDFNNICRKRLPFTQMYQRIQKAFPNTIITGSDLATIRQIMKDHGVTVACGLCYVEDRRQLLGEIATSFIDEMKGGFENYAKGSETKRRNAEKFRKLLGDDTKEDLSIYDLITLEGSSRLAQEHPGIYQAFQTFNAARGQQAGNLFQGYAEYKREILKWNKKKVASVNANGGLRIFSYSDFEAHHLIDLVQIIQDCARKGVMIQGYTKVPAFARAVANTGIKLNRSLIPLGDTGIVDGQLAYDPVEGIDINDKDFLPDNDNIGNILIGINDEQIRLAMADPFVHYIIPYHSNQSGVLRQMKQTGAWTNYKNEQTEKGQNVGHGVNIYTDVLAPAEAEGNPIKNEREFVERFLQVCKEKGWTPRFARFLNTDENGDYLYTPGYYKLLLDFKLFDADGNILPQRPVVAEFDDEFNRSILEDYVRGERGNADESLDDVYNEIVSKLGLSDREADIRRTNAESDRLTSMLNAARALREANATQKQPVSAERTQEPVSTTDAEESIMFSLSRNNRATIQSWLNKREDLTDEQRSGVMDYLDGLKDSKTQLATARWFVNGTIRIPEDMKKVEQAIYVAGRAKVDPLRYSSPMELLEAHAEFKPKEDRINPDEVSTLHRAAEYPDQGIVVYDVDNTEESRRNMRKIINTHFGEDASPWCLLQGDGKGNLTTDSKRYWRHYSAYPKQVAFRDGKLLAFSANDTHTRLWWDRQDQSHYGIPMLLKVPGDELGRSADHIIDENGNLIVEPGAHMYRGNKQNGVYEEWSSDGETLLQRAEYKDGVENGVTEQWYPSGQLWRRTGMKNGEYAGTYEMWYENGQQRLIVEFDENGDRHGTQRGWYKDGKLHQEFHYNHGQFDGEQRDYDDDGNLSSVRRYNNGNLVGFEDHGPFGIEKRVTYTSDSNNHRVVELFRRNGSLSERAEYDGTTLNGVREIYNADGGIQTRANYVYGDRNGLFETYHPNGKLWVRGEYKFGNRDGIHEQWDKDGNLISRVEFRNDEKVRDLPIDESEVRFSKSVFTPTDKGRDESSMNYAMRIAYGFDTAYNTGSRGWEFENGEGQESSMAYSRKTKKIHIFVKDQMPSGEEMEMLCFHESLHAWMDRMPAREKEQLVSDYNDADFFVNPGTKELVYEGIRNRKYRDEDVPEEYLTHTLSQAMEIGMTQRILDEMPDASRDLLQGLFNSIDYNVEEESNRRRAQRNGGVREGTSTESGERADLRNSVAERAGEGGAREGREQVEDSVRFSKTTSNEELFDKAKERFGTTRDIREAGYVLPDGTMLDFSGRHMASGDTSYLNGGRTVDHRDIEDLNFESDLNTPSGIETNMPDFIRRGAIRIDSNGLINLSVKPTKSQESVLRRLISRNGFMAVDFGDGNSTRAYAEYDRPNAERILGDISDYFDYGIKPEGDGGLRFSKANQTQNGFISNAEAALDKIKMDKATPEQWIKMLEKEGGLKAGEDKWLGLSDWLKASDRKTLTKQEIADYIAENRIEIEEVNYSANVDMEEAVKNDIQETIGRGKSIEELQEEIDELKESAARFDAIGENPSEEEMDDYLTEAMIEDYGDDFTNGYIIEDGFIDYNVSPYDLDEDEFNRSTSGTRKINETRLSYTTSGLDNKREIALTVPTIDSWNENDEIHFGDAGNGRAVAWIRFGDTRLESPEKKAVDSYLAEMREKYSAIPGEETDRMTPEEISHLQELTGRELDNPNSGPKVLVIDEIQSKRHQEGREHGYNDQRVITTLQEEEEDAKRAYDNYIESLKEKYGGFNGMYGNVTEEENRRAEELNDAHIAASNKVLNAIGGIPAAPFEKNWHELAMKRMLRLAAEEGYDKIAWTTGDQQAERYNIGTALSKIEAERDSEGYHIITYDKTGYPSGVVRPYYNSDEEVLETFGKDLGSRILSSLSDEDSITLSGDDLRIGGEGMKGFYDDILPRFMNKYGKKWGVKVEDIDLPRIYDETGRPLTMHSVPVTKEMKDSVMEGQLMFSKTSAKTESGESINFESTGGLPEKSGRTSLVERTYRKTGAFSFTGKEKIESAADVAYIFKELETSATENSFIVFVKDGKPTILHTGIGTIDRTEIDSAPMVAGLKDFAPDMIYMVHNHPSGRVEASTADGKELDRLQGMAGDIPVQGVIIDTVTGEYGVFDRELGSTLIDNRHGEEANAIPLEVLTFDRMVFAPEYRSEIGKNQIANAESVAAYLSAHRLGDGEKVGALLLNRANQVVGNLVFNDNVLTEDNAESLAGDAVDAAVRSAASSVIIYGDMSADKKTIWSFKNSIDRIGGGNVRWLDAVKVEGNHTKSLAEGTLMDDGENKSEILSHVNDRLDQISRISQTPSSISKTGNQGEIIPTETGGREGVESDTNVGNNIDIPNQLVKKTADFINQLTYDNSIDANNYIEKLINALGYKVMNQHSGYVRFENKDGESVFLRLSDHRAHARNQIGIKADNKYSIAILVDSSPEVRFRPSRRVRMVEYVYDHPDNERLVNITKSIFNLFDSGRYVDLANANETNTSPNPNAVLRDIAAEDSELRFSKSVETVQDMDRNGLGSVIGEDNVNDFYNEVYRIATPEIRRSIAERAEAYGYNFREATKDYLAGLAMAGYQNDDTGMLRAVAGLLNGYAADGIGIDENSLRYILWKQGRSDNGEILNIASDIAMRRRLGVGEFADPIRFSKAPTENLSEAAENVRSEYDTAIEEAKQTLDEKKKVLKGNLITLAKAMAIQREYDQNTVDSLVKLVKQLMREGGVDSLTAREMGRMLGLINHSVGKKNLTKNANALMDVVIDNLMKKERDAFEKLLNIKGSKVNAKGVEVQGKLDIEGQRVVKAVKAGLAMTEDEVKERMNDLSDRMDSNDDTIAEEAKAEYAGLQLALDYHSSITDSIGEETGLENERNDAMTQRREGKMTKQAFDEFMKDVDSSMRENHIERVEAFRELRTKLVSILSGSIDAAKEFREREKERIENIHHLANSDMQGISSDEHVRDDKNFWQRLSNSSIVRFLMSPLASFDQMLRLFGSKNINGEGYLWNKFHRGWVEATENEYTGMKEATRELDEKVSSVFGKEMMWSDLYEVERKMPKVTVKFWDGGQMKDHELTQGNLLYIYMVNKMSDGRMKLRRMGIEEEDVQAIVRQMDPRFIELADWLQNEYLVNKRNKYNAVHERMFGASMAAIDNYFPIKILSNARTKEEDVSNMNDEEALPSTTTGSIIKRRRNSLALDVLGSDAFSVVIEHLEQMEHWAAFAEFNRDINTLLSYKRFRNQAQNMDSVYGSGKKLWNNFKSVCRIAAGTYRPSVKAESLDTAAMNVAKGVTAAKISFRVYTALKQFLSMPAFIADANVKYLAENMATPWKSWNWAMENLPIFEKRWKSRQAGDTRLMQTDSDWKLWRNKIIEKASQWGMSPNAFVDALTVSIGAHAMYQTKYDKYIKAGYSEEQADKKAKQDATTLYNETQQSSEGAFVSPVQLDRTVFSVMITVFRNSSMGYQRQLHDAVRNIGKMMKSGYKEESIAFMKKQMMRDGLTEEQAQHAAEREYGNALAHNATRIATFGFLVQFAWNLGGSLAYLLLGDDDDEKEKMLEDAARKGLIGGTIEGLAGGNVASEALDMLAKGESLQNYDPSLLPIFSDMKRVYQMMGYDKVAAANELVNLAIQAGIGVNPQTLTDAIVAVEDACGGDLDTSKEAMLLIMRVLQVPQSQIDKIYIDELGVNAGEAQKMTYGEMAERYANYKVERGAPLTGWAYQDELENKREKAYLKRFKKMVKERNENKQ